MSHNRGGSERALGTMDDVLLDSPEIRTGIQCNEKFSSDTRRCVYLSDVKLCDSGEETRNLRPSSAVKLCFKRRFVKVVPLLIDIGTSHSRGGWEHEHEQNTFGNSYLGRFRTHFSSLSYLKGGPTHRPI